MIGMKVSLPGNDVDSGDVNLAFSSEWPVLRIIKSGELKVLGETLTTIPHNLGFTPLIVTWSKTNGFLDMPRQNIFVNTKNIFWSHSGTGNQLDDTFIIVFNIDIETPFQAPKVNLSTSSSATSTSNVGIRFTKVSKDTSSTDLRDYIIHSSARSPLLHAVAPLTKKSASIPVPVSYSHDLPYSPIFIAFSQTDVAGVGEPVYVLANNFANMSTNGNTISITGLKNGYKASVIVLKDPFLIDSNITMVTVG